MVVKYIIQMTHHRILREDLPYYYKGQDKEGINRFDTRKEKAKRYLRIEEAYRDMRILEAMHVCKADSFKVVQISCKNK